MDKPTLADLRALALDYRAEIPYFVCLDRDRRMDLSLIKAEMTRLQERKDDLANGDADADTNRSMSDPDETVEITRRLAELGTELEAAMEEARPWSVAIIFGSIPTTDDGARPGEASYESLVELMTDEDGKIDTDAFADELLRLCYLRTETAEGNLELTWQEAARLADATDWALLRRMVIGHHKVGNTIPFDPRTSGPSATT